MKRAATLVLAATASVSIAMTAPADAAETESGLLVCGSTSYVVTGYGRGTPLKLTTSTGNYVVKYARIEPSGEVVSDVRGQDGRADLVTCTTTVPSSGRGYTFQGFFTPRSA